MIEQPDNEKPRNALTGDHDPSIDWDEAQRKLAAWRSRYPEITKHWRANMTFKITFDPIGNRIQMSMDLDNLSGRDKCNLLNALMDNMGLTERISAAPDSCESFQLIWKERMDAHWNARGLEVPPQRLPHRDRIG
jgi:transposase-like protein